MCEVILTGFSRFIEKENSLCLQIYTDCINIVSVKEEKEDDYG